MLVSHIPSHLQQKKKMSVNLRRNDKEKKTTGERIPASLQNYRKLTILPLISIKLFHFDSFPKIKWKLFGCLLWTHSTYSAVYSPSRHVWVCGRRIPCIYVWIGLLPASRFTLEAHRNKLTRHSQLTQRLLMARRL